MSRPNAKKKSKSHDSSGYGLLDGVVSFFTGSSSRNEEAERRLEEERLRIEQENALFEAKLRQLQRENEAKERVREERDRLDTIERARERERYEREQDQLAEQRRVVLTRDVEMERIRRKEEYRRKDQEREERTNQFKLENQKAEEKAAKAREEYKREEAERLERWEENTRKVDAERVEKNLQFAREFEREESLRKEMLEEAEQEYRRLLQKMADDIARAAADAEIRRAQAMEMYRMLMQAMAFRAWTDKVEEKWSKMLHSIRRLADAVVRAFEELSIHYSVLCTGDDSKRRALFQMHLELLSNALQTSNDDAEDRIDQFNSMITEHPEAVYVTDILEATKDLHSALLSMINPVEQLKQTQAHLRVAELEAVWTRIQEEQQGIKTATEGIPTVTELKNKYKQANQQSDGGPIIEEVDD